MYPAQARRMLLRLNSRLAFHDGPENNYASAGVYLREADKLQPDRMRFLFGVPLDWVPEKDEIDETTGRLVRPGWRTLIVRLWELGLVEDRDYYRTLTRGWRPHPML